MAKWLPTFYTPYSHDDFADVLDQNFGLRKFFVGKNKCGIVGQDFKGPW